MTQKEFRDKIKAVRDAPADEQHAFIESLGEQEKDLVSFTLRADYFKKFPEEKRLTAFFDFLISSSADLERRFGIAV